MLANHEIYQSQADVLNGLPVFTGTRVPIQNLFDYLEGGDTLQDFLEDFPSVREEQVVALLEKSKDLIHEEATSRRVCA